MIQRKAPHLLLVVFLVCSCFFMSARPANAAVSSIGSWIRGIFTNNSTTKSVTAFSSKNADKEKFDAESMSNILTNIGLHAIGMGAIPNDGSLSQADRATLEKEIGYGALGDVNKGIVALYTPPASSRTYIADLMQSAKIIPQAQAQGLGFASLSPILDTWKMFRNLAYLFFVVIFLVIGFMIMFRTKVGQAAITAQQAIPSLIIAMLAVTFSYAIAGFMIDIMYVIMYMIAGFFSEGSDVVSTNFFGLISLMFQGGDTTKTVLDTVQGFMSETLTNSGLAPLFGAVAGWITGLSATVIVAVVILFASFKIFFELIKTYVSVIIQIIFSPITLMMGAIPGKNVFSGWIRNLAGNLILWPVVLLCILVQRMLTASIRAGGTTEAGGFMPPFLIGQGQSGIVPVIVGLGVLLIIPDIMKQIKKAMGIEEGMFGGLAQGAGTALSEAWRGGKIEGVPFKSPIGARDVVVGAPKAVFGLGAKQASENISVTGNILGKAPSVEQSIGASVGAQAVSKGNRPATPPIVMTAKGKQNADILKVEERAEEQKKNAQASGLSGGISDFDN